MSESEQITCQICGGQCHAIRLHLRDNHPEVTVEQYAAKFPDAPLLSKLAQAKVDAHLAAKAKEVAPAPVVGAPAETLTTAMVGSTAMVRDLVHPGTVVKKPLHEVFGLGKVKAAMNPSGDPINITTIFKADDSHAPIPEVDDGYVYDIENLKNVLLGMELNMPIYIWGHAGTGKTTLAEQVSARTGRPFMRVQHTVNTEEAHIVGQWTVKDGHTVFELGPLPVAMLNGLVYCADEYDFALPNVIAVYQSVLEGKSLVIKEADKTNRIIKPHANFRFMATGNTNGSGDESGLYQGTNIQNAANYDRFAVVIQQLYMKPAMESQILQNQARIVKEDADKLVEFGRMVREAFAAGKVGATVSPRALINAGKIGARRASFRMGLALAFTNKLAKIDRETVDGIAQRVFG
jgi:cobaltochelatase CobS